MIAIDQFKTRNSLHIESVESHAEINERVESVCVVAQFGCDDKRHYSIQVSADSWMSLCSHIPSDDSQSTCPETPPVVRLSREDIRQRCEATSGPQHYSVYLDATDSGKLMISEAGGGQKLLQLNASMTTEKVSPWVIPMLPVTVAMDVLTIPVQIVGAIMTFFFVVGGK